MGSHDPVEAAYREGKIPAERRAHYYKLMASKPKATKRALATMEAVLPPPGSGDAEDMTRYIGQSSHTAAHGAAPVGPTEHLGPAATPAPQSFGVGGNVIREPDNAGPAQPGEVL